jgi:hypothetical protein
MGLTAEMYAIVRAMRESMRPFEVVPDPPYRLNRRPRLYPKGCYVRAYRYVMDHGTTDALLVHGLYHDGKDHAWVEIPGGVVYDGVLDCFYQAEAYYLTMMAEPQVKYTAKEAGKKGSAARNFGPWHTPPGTTRGEVG